MQAWASGNCRAGEDTLYRILIAALHPVITPVTAKLLHAASLVVSFLVISYLHVVLGEVVPKNLAMAQADRVAALVAPGRYCCSIVVVTWSLLSW